MTDYSLLTERVVLEKFKAGDQESGNELFKRYRGRLYAMCLNITRNNDIAIEAVQETFYRLLNLRNRIDPDRNFSALVHKMAYNICMDELRRKKQSTPLDDLNWVEGESESVDALAVATEKRIEMKAVWAAVDRLPLSAKTLIELRYRSSLTPEEIASVLELPAATVRVRLHRARKLLAGYLLMPHAPENGTEEPPKP